MEILKVEHLVKQYGKGDNAVLAVNDISFSVEQGEFVAIVGSSGSGKSTLVNDILGKSLMRNQHFFTCLAVWTDLQVERYIYRVRIYIH